VPRLKRLVASMSPQRPWFLAGLHHVWFVVDNAALGQVFLRVFRFPRSLFHSTNASHSSSPTKVIATDERVKPSVLPTKVMLFRNRGASRKKGNFYCLSLQDLIISQSPIIASRLFDFGISTYRSVEHLYGTLLRKAVVCTQRNPRKPGLVSKHFEHFLSLPDVR
jgi:hypothetical protein